MKPALWKQETFRPLPKTSTFGLHCIGALPTVLVADTNGVLHWVDGTRKIDLGRSVKRSRNIPLTCLLELVASDSAVMAGFADGEFFFATCWIQYDKHLTPVRYLAAFFHIFPDKQAELWTVFSLTEMPSLCRLTSDSPVVSGLLHWLIFTQNKPTKAYSIEPSARQVTLVEEVGDVFPVLELYDIRGCAIRSHCWTTPDWRFSLVGFDSGYVVASVCQTNSGTIVDRKAFKFAGPVSVLKFIDNPLDVGTCTGTGTGDVITAFVLASSTVGPAVVWRLTLDDEVLKWAFCTELAGTDTQDAVLCGAFGGDNVLIGTFSEYVLAYDLAAIIAGPSAPTIDRIYVGSPVVAVRHVPADDSILVLSYQGFHRFRITK